MAAGPVATRGKFPPWLAASLYLLPAVAQEFQSRRFDPRIAHQAPLHQEAIAANRLGESSRCLSAPTPPGTAQG